MRYWGISHLKKCQPASEIFPFHILLRGWVSGWWWVRLGAGGENEEEWLHLIFSHRHSTIVAIVAIRLPLFSHSLSSAALTAQLT